LAPLNLDRLHAAFGELLAAHLGLLSRQPLDRIVRAWVVVILEQQIHVARVGQHS
jgi:hypothetical protein